MLSSAFPHILYLLSSWVLPIFAWTKFVLNTCSSAAKIRASVSLLRFPSINHNHWSLSANSFVCLRNYKCVISSLHSVFLSLLKFSFSFFWSVVFGIFLMFFDRKYLICLERFFCFLCWWCYRFYCSLGRVGVPLQVL